MLNIWFIQRHLALISNLRNIRLKGSVSRKIIESACVENMERIHKMSELNLQGVFPPITTPFVDGRVAHNKLADNIEKWCTTGLKGFVALGSNGEYVYLSGEEKRAVVETAAKAAPDDKLIIAGTGCESTQETIKLTNDCARLGARAALVITPHYYGGRMSDAALISHFTTVADNTAIPVLLYNVPKFTHISMTAGVVSRLAKHPNIVGLKESSGNVNLLGQYINNVGDDFQVMVGTAGVLFGGITIGCTGGILALANVAPRECVEIYDLAMAGKFEEARQLQLKMIAPNNAVTAIYGVPGLKAAMDMLGYFGGEPRSPLLSASEKEKQEIRQILIKADLLE
jgi:4-hydroxy-2-oxoglutarate aldolase